MVKPSTFGSRPELAVAQGDSSNGPTRFLSGILFCLPVVLFACTELSVPPGIQNEFVLEAPEDGPLVELSIQGDDLTETEWVRSYTRYRIVFDDMENTTGSIKSLLEPSLIQALHRNEMRLSNPSVLEDANRQLAPVQHSPGPDARAEPSESTAPDCRWKVEILQRDISYFPRREFIQTAGGIRPGHIVTLFRYRYCLEERCQDYQMDRTNTVYPDEAKERLEMEASMIFKQMQEDAYEFLDKHRSLCGASRNEP